MSSVSLSGLRLTPDEAAQLAWVEDVVHIRNQAVAVVGLDASALASEQARLGRAGEVEIVVAPEGARGPVSRNAGPFTGVCERVMLNYDASGEAAPVWSPPSSSEERRGVATYCYSVEDCAAAGTDMLLMVADELHSSPVLFALANHHATYLGLNISVVGTSALTELTAEALRQFIKDVYDTQSAAHFGDGHLGFVQLIGDAYSDDNTTVMIPTYDGYGGTEVASDHYYACVSGDDDYEDVMIGRFSVGNVGELVSVVGKNANYMPQQSGDAWTESTLLVSGLFYSIKDDYVTLFDEYEELMPHDWNVDRIYRHDYENNHLCSLDVVDGFDDGHLIVNYAGDGWISEWYHVMDTTDIPRMENGGRLPIVLSMACMTGWYDNTTEVDQTGSYDCFAEQIVNTSGKGAIACLASPRASDGGMFRTLTKNIYRAVFTEHCTFLGETMAVAKLLHVQSGGSVDYARHFNLFGDAALIYRWVDEPTDSPELVVRPSEVLITPELPAVGDDLTLEITVRNQSTLAVSDVLLRISDVSSAGSYSQDIIIPYLDDWSYQTVSTVIPALPGAGHLVTIEIDPDDDIEEIDETNNTNTFDVFVYPHVAGFPADTGADPIGPCLARLDQSDDHVILLEADARVRAIDSAGSTIWLTDAATAAVDYGPEIAPAVGDLDGDGVNEIIATRRMGLAAFDSDGEELWSIITDDPVGAPVLADVDADGDLDVLLATKMFFGGSSKIVAVDEDGGVIWYHSLPSGDPASATPAVGDFDMDGYPDFAFGTFDGMVGAASCSQIPPVELWAPVALGSSSITTVALADLDGDGVLEIAATGDGLYARNAEDGTECWTATLDAPVAALALGDVDSNGSTDAVAASEDGTLYVLSGGTETWSTTLWSRPAPSIAIADVIDDAGMEIVVHTEDGLLHVIGSGGHPAATPLPIPGEGCASPFVADLTGDGRPELSVSSCEGRVFAFEFDGTTQEPAIEWHGQGGTASRGGLMVQPFAGSITGGATLHGRYVITGDVTIESGASVTILPDALFEFDSVAAPRLEVWGTLNVMGHPGAEVTLQGTQTTSRATWGGLNFKAGSSATLASCRIADATVGIKGYQATVDLENCSVLGGVVAARFVNCTLDARTSTFSSADSLGMYLDGGDGAITDCVFDGNGHAGLWCDDYASHDILRSSFTGTIAGEGARFYRYSNAQVDSCTISGNNGDGVLVHSASPAFEGCVISENYLTGIHCRRLASPMVCWSVIENNRIGVTAETGASPNLGDTVNSSTGFNSVSGNSMAAVANYTDSELPINICENWWGAYPPIGRIFIGYVRYYPCLQSPPDPDPGGGGRIDDAGFDAIPSAFGLGHCSPNPFNPVTSIRFDVPQSAGHVDVSVFDVAGRRVTTLYSGHHDPGTHSVTWDGRDERGRHVASGIYFVHMNAADFRASRKMVLLK